MSMKGIAMSSRDHVCRYAVGAALLLLGVGVLQAQQPADEIKSLQKERIEKLVQVVEILTQQFISGRGSMESLRDAERELLKAELELSENPKERIAVIQKVSKDATNLARIAKMGFDAGKFAKTELLQAEAFELEIRIHLLKEQQKLKASEKK
jgi:outer membrane protein TolC